MDVMTKRPEGMSIEEYKKSRLLQDIKLKHHLKGKMVWLSKLKPTTKAINLAHELGSEYMSLFNVGRTYRKGEEKK